MVYQGSYRRNESNLLNIELFIKNIKLQIETFNEENNSVALEKYVFEIHNGPVGKISQFYPD